jgi:hypothetical protein
MFICSEAVSNKEAEMTQGVTNLATGRKIYLDECVFSATSLKKHCPDIPVTLFTEKSDIKESCFDDILTIRNGAHLFKDKVKCSLLSPYESTLYLDCDIQILQPIYEMFEWLKEYDLGVANTPCRDHSRKLIGYTRGDFNERSLKDIILN